MTEPRLMGRYHREVIDIIERIHTEEPGRILAVARVLADQVARDGLIYIFGPGGHSNLAAMEIFFRAGGLMHVSAILNQETMLSAGALKSMQTERLPGYGRIVVEDYGIGTGDVLIVVNAYGINAATIDAALTARERGATVVGVCSFAHAEQTAPEHIARHPSKQNLHEVVDYAIDCKVPIGDAVLQLEGLAQPIGALSTFANAYALNSAVIEAIALLVEEGVEPPIWRSGNAPGGDEWNNRFIDRFRDRIRLL